MSLVSLIGPRPSLLDLNTGGSHKRLEVEHPILTNMGLERIRRIENHVDHAFRTERLSMCYPVSEGAAGMRSALESFANRPSTESAPVITS